MKSSVLLFALALLIPSFSHAAPPATAQLTQAEITLAQLINNYRATRGLPAVALSASLSKVAQTHAWDSMVNPSVAPCNPHSWSNKGSWSAFCYQGGPDGSGMWNKPKELTSYVGSGYEITAGASSGTMTPELALSLWQSSTPHNDVILNLSSWTQPWRAMGVGIYQGFAHVWFGMEVDPAGPPVPGALSASPVIAANKYYRIKNLRLEAEGKCLDGNANAPAGVPQGAAYMAPCGSSLGQAWLFIPIGNGYYRLSTGIGSPQNKCLEGNQYPNGLTLRGATFLDNLQNVSGQIWYMFPQGGHGYMQMTTAFRAPFNECFVGNPINASIPLGGAALMSKCDNGATQLWRVEPF
jgi:hypothetical protein